ncbi:hypothetical protein ZIOFF_057322 [Zingiber officinale]|uniref:Protein kinase domain-containing protein n=1 Tax=Zingiber officinale TaxID=94328 RepID=A0A8J5KID5_ZINOF|nr:hypothetical protein ZIOFF_057322 [Zingiber officinale]
MDNLKNFSWVNSDMNEKDIDFLEVSIDSDGYEFDELEEEKRLPLGNQNVELGSAKASEIVEKIHENEEGEEVVGTIKMKIEKPEKEGCEEHVEIEDIGLQNDLLKKREKKVIAWWCRIQYPFGIGHGCHLPGFNLTCREQTDSSVPARLFMGDGTLGVSSIDLPSGYVYFKLPVISMGVNQPSITAPLIDLQNYNNFNFWAANNSLFVSGCNVRASLVDLANNNTIISNCTTICLDGSSELLPFVIQRPNCSIPIGKRLPHRVFLGVTLTPLYQVSALHLGNATAVSAASYTDSLFALFCNQTSTPPILQYQNKNVTDVDVQRGELHLMNVGNSSLVFTLAEGRYVYRWFIPHQSCEDAERNKSLFACVSVDSTCLDINGSKEDSLGYRCSCIEGYTGNPYVLNGCQDINECDNPEKYICEGICKNTKGSYYCIPPTKKRTLMLDDNLVAKVSDFGASRFIPLDQNYIITAVQGTFGYLDPEYYQTSELTEKSDVYSFGVILLELLTGKAPIYSNEHGNEVNLSKQFLQAMRENHALDLVEDRVLKEGNREELLEIMQMVEMCLRLKGAERPTMKEVEHKLQGLRRNKMMKKRLPSFAEDKETTETNLSDAFDPSTESVDERNQGTSTSYSSEKALMYQQLYSPR